jgi:septal ring-binding cell division protein DamX
MWTFIPGSVRKFRRENPYNHPFVFLLVDLTDSALKTAIVAGLLFGGFHFVKQQLSVAESRELAISDQPRTDDHAYLEYAVVVAASSEILQANESNPSPQVSGNSLLDGSPGIRWINDLPDSHYVIQYAASIDKTSLIEFANNHLQKGAVIYPFKTTAENDVMYGLASGLYESLFIALQTVDKLPEPIAIHSPWVRPVVELKAEVAAIANQ